MWQWASTSPGSDPAAGRHGLGSGHRFEGEPPVDDPQIPFLRLGKEDATHV